MAVSALLAGVVMSSAGGGAADALAMVGDAGQRSSGRAIAAATQEPDPPYDTPTPSDSDARAMVELVNQHRRTNGVAPLVFDVDFSDRTEPFALGLASEFPPPAPIPGKRFLCARGDLRHDDSRSIWASMPPGAVMWGENLARTCSDHFDDNVKNAFKSLVRSDGHNENMLDPRFTHIAVSVVHFGHSTFVVQRFAEVPDGVPPVGSTPPTVRADSSCLVGRGRIDIRVTNPGATAASYSVRVTGTRGFSTTRNIEVGANQTGRVTVTGRFDGEHEIAVRPADQPAADPVTSSVDVACANGEVTQPVVVVQSCVQNNGRIDVYVANNTSSTKTYVVRVESGEVGDRSITLAGGTKDRVTVTGRPDGKIPVTVLLDGAILSRQEVNVACDS